MTKIVYNACYGGFGLSTEARERYAELAGIDESQLEVYELERTDPTLVQVVEELGERADGRFSNLFIRKLAEGTLYRIDEYDGWERVVTQDEYDWKVA